VEQPRNPNDPIPRDTRWTNQILIEKASLKVEAVFKSNDTCPKPDETGRDHFVTEFKYGIVAAASDRAYQLLAHGQWFSLGTPASSTTKTGRHDIAESGEKSLKIPKGLILYS
jgi:hypothetical protein